MKYRKGFTLIELLVVIAIIGILSSVVLASLNMARKKARDAKRVSGLNQLVTAIEMFYLDNGYYPSCSGKTYCSSTYVPNSGWGDWVTLQIVPDYTGIILDPINIQNQYGYVYARGYKPTSAITWASTGDDKHYVIYTKLENTSNANIAVCWDFCGNLLKGQ